MKSIVYIAIDNGIDGRDKETIRFASLVEAERDAFIANSPNKNWLTAGERIYQLDKVAETAWNRLDGVERLALQRQRASHGSWVEDYDRSVRYGGL